MSQLRSQLAGIGWQELAGDQKCAFGVRGRAQPCLQSVVQSFSYGTDAGEQNPKAAPRREWSLGRIKQSFIVTIFMVQQAFPRESLAEEGLHHEIRGTQQPVGVPILLL